MARKDLLSLTPSDLESLSNRGTIKRALREVQEREVPFQIEESDAGDVKVTAGDDTTCTLPANKGLNAATCSCGTDCMCRHIIRAVIAYQAFQALDRDTETGHASSVQSEEIADAGLPPTGTAPTSVPPTGTAPTSVPPTGTPPTSVPETARGTIWNPGLISDEIINAQFKPAVLEKARRLNTSGLLVEVVKTVRPYARFLTLAHTVRFLVEGDINYAHCDCGDDQCIHVPIAVWSFRLLDDSMEASVVGTSFTAVIPPVHLFDQLETFLTQILETGIGALSSGFMVELRRVPQRCIESDLHWIAGAFEDLCVEIERHQKGDALYEPQRVAELIGEITARMDALRNYTGALPYLLLQGYSFDAKGDAKTKRLIGLGCGAKLERKHLVLTAYFQDTRSGEILTSSRRTAIQDEDQLSFSKEAAKPALKGISLLDIAQGQLLAKSGKLTASREYSLGRTGVSVNRQAFNWDLLRPPYYAESFRELQAISSLRPPAIISSRVSTTNFFVCPISSVTGAYFDTGRQTLIAELEDTNSDRATLLMPFVTAAAKGIERLLRHLQEAPDAVRYVAGHFKRDRTGLIVKPVSVVVEDNAGNRHLIQPFVDGKITSVVKPDVPISLRDTKPNDPVDFFPGEVIEALGELATVGLRRCTDETCKRWRMLASELQSSGFTLLAGHAQTLVNALESKKFQMQWNTAPASRAFLTCAVAAAVALEESQ